MKYVSFSSVWRHRADFRQPDAAPYAGKTQICLMPVQLGLVLPSLLVILKSLTMHGLPCSSLGHCFGNPSDVSPDPSSVPEPNISTQSGSSNGPPAVPVTSQPEAVQRSRQELQHEQPGRTISCSTSYSNRIRNVNGTNANSVCHPQGTDGALCSESPRLSLSASQSSEDDELDFECGLELELNYPHIPRPSIIIRQRKVRRHNNEEVYISILYKHVFGSNVTHSSGKFAIYNTSTFVLKQQNFREMLYDAIFYHTY